MEYRVSKVPTLGQGLPLHNVAVSMAYADANDKGGFIESAYERRLREHINVLVTEARAGNLEITSRDGKCGTMEQIVFHAQLNRNSLSNVNDPNVAESLAAFTFLPMLNKWGQRFGYTFVFAEHDSHAEIVEGDTQLNLGGKPSLPPTHGESIITDQNDTLNKVIANKPKHETKRGINKVQVLIAFDGLLQIKLSKALSDGKGVFGENGARVCKGTRGVGGHESLWKVQVFIGND